MAMAKCVGYQPDFPQYSEAMVAAWAEAFERGHVTDERDVLEGVARAYEDHGDPGWRITPKVVVTYAQKVRRERVYAEKVAELEAQDTRPKITFAEFRKRHPEVKFPTFGKSVPGE